MWKANQTLDSYGDKEDQQHKVFIKKAEVDVLTFVNSNIFSISKGDLIICFKSDGCHASLTPLHAFTNQDV